MKFICTIAAFSAAGILFAQRDTSYAYHPRDSIREAGHHFTWGPDLSLGCNFRSISSNRYSELIDRRNKEESYTLLWNFGFLFHFRVSKYFEITTGIRSSRSGYTLKEELSLNDTLEYEYGAACDVYHAMDPVDGWKDPYVFSDPRYGFLIHGYHPSNAELSMNVIYKYIEVPLKFRFVMGQHAMKYFLGAGASPNYMMRQSIHDAFTYEETSIGTADVNEIPGAHFHRLNLGLSSGFGISFHSRHNTDIELHADGVWQARELFDQKNVLLKNYHEHHYRIEAGISICYYIVLTEDKR